MSHDTRGTTDVAGDVVPVDETDGEIDVREFDGGMNSVSPGDKTDWRLKTPSSVCRTNTSPDKIYLLAKILESLGSMLCLSERSQKGVSSRNSNKYALYQALHNRAEIERLGGEAESRLFALGSVYAIHAAS